MSLPLNQIQLAAQQTFPATIEFARQLISIPSMSGKESHIAQAIANEMTRLGYDEVRTDQAGNVIGKISGGDGPAVILNGHMDHVDAGPAENWPYPPFSGQIVDNELWGRGSLDMKGPVACMIHAAAIFKQLGLAPPGDVYVTIAVFEELGGLGTQHLTSHLKAQAAICGEPSHNVLRRGHRGRVELVAEFIGKPIHASVPHLGLNPHYGAAAFIQALAGLSMPNDSTLGASTVAPTLYRTDQISPNVVPGHVYLTLDWRNIPQETPAEVVQKLQSLLDATLAGSDLTATVAVTTTKLTTYTGLSVDFPSIFPSFLLPEAHPLVQAAHQSLVEVLGRDDGINIWRFATDGGHLMMAGIPTVGFGPGDETLAHTNQERLNLDQMKESIAGYAAITLALGQAA
jgi:putative selenium metabolism hydrolase